MLGAIYIGLSGLDAYSHGLKQVSNNVSNLNSAGFKSGIVSFSDLAGPNSSGDYGSFGQNGRGVALNAGRTDFRQGDLQQTGRDLDLAINGNGFLVLLDGNRTLYARTGSFEVNSDGYIVLSGTNYRLATLDGGNHPVSLSIDHYRTNPPQATTRISFSGNLSSTATSFGISDVTVHDTDGTAHTWQLQFERDTEAEGVSWKLTVTDDKNNTIGQQTLAFTGGAIDPANSTLTFEDADSGLSVAFDFSENVTGYSSGEVSSLQTASVDGYGTGSITSIKVNTDGHLEIGYSNEQKKDLGTIAIADFRDAGTLEAQNGGLYVATGDGGRQLYASGSAGIGKIVSGQIEGSNVDLSREFGELILIQRGFQASSQIISVSNDMIQQLFGIRGQG